MKKSLLQKFGNSLPLIFFGILLISGALYFKAIEAQNQPVSAEPKPVAVDVATELSTFVVNRQFAGRINATKVSDLAFELSGEVISIEVEEGDLVYKGDRLARLNTDSLLTRQSELLASRREAQAQLIRAQATFERIERLVPEAATPQQLDNTRGERDAIKARVDQLNASLATLNVSKANANLVAPYDGQIVLRYIDEGTVISPGEKVLRLNGGGALEAEIGIPSRFRSQIEIGAQYELNAGSIKGKGIAKQIVNDINPRTRTVTVLFTIIEDPGFVPSDLVRITLPEIVRADGIWVNNGALVESLKGLWAVYTVQMSPKPNRSADDVLIGHIVRNDIEIVHTEENRSFVRGTLEDGSYVVRSSPFRFVPGQKVQVTSGATVLPSSHVPNKPTFERE